MVRIFINKYFVLLITKDKIQIINTDTYKTKHVFLNIFDDFAMLLKSSSFLVDIKNII